MHSVAYWVLLSLSSTWSGHQPHVEMSLLPRHAKSPSGFREPLRPINSSPKAQDADQLPFSSSPDDHYHAQDTDQLPTTSPDHQHH